MTTVPSKNLDDTVAPPPCQGLLSNYYSSLISKGGQGYRLLILQGVSFEFLTSVLKFILNCTNNFSVGTIFLSVIFIILFILWG